MSLRNPEVIAGARGVREERATLAAAAQAKRDSVSVVPESETWYQARYSRLRIQLTAPRDVVLPDGRVVRDLPIVAQFSDAFLKLKDSVPKDRKIKELIAAHPRYGVDFWDFADVLARSKDQERSKVLDVLKDAEQRRLIVDALKAEGVDFELPIARTKSKEYGAGT